MIDDKNIRVVLAEADVTPDVVIGCDHAVAEPDRTVGVVSDHPQAIDLRCQYALVVDGPRRYRTACPNPPPVTLEAARKFIKDWVFAGPGDAADREAACRALLAAVDHPAAAVEVETRVDPSMRWTVHAVLKGPSNPEPMRGNPVIADLRANAERLIAACAEPVGGFTGALNFVNGRLVSVVPGRPV